jgi:hypothetical protein
MMNLKTTTALALCLVCSASRSAAQLPGTFTATGNTMTPRFAHSATLLPNGKVLIAGENTVCTIGFPPGFPPCTVAPGAELYDPATGSSRLPAA